MENAFFEKSSLQTNGQSSPQWVKPNDLLRQRKRMRRAMSANALQPLNQNVIAGNQILLRNEPSKSATNPFRCSIVKRGRENEDYDACIPNDVHQKRLSMRFQISVNPVIVDALNEDANFGTYLQRLPSNTGTAKGDNEKWYSYLPVDWSIKTKARFMSTTPYSWRGSFKASEEASGITGFARCLYTERNEQECSLDTCTSSRLYQHCLYWMFPSLPWLVLFPRVYPPKDKEKTRQPSIFGTNSTLQENLHEEWCVSFRSLYNLVKARQCAFFYVCASAFTVLFRAAGVGGVPSLHALINPTPKSLRQALTDEGIEFSMPLRKEINGEMGVSSVPAQDAASQDNYSQDMSKFHEVEGVNPNTTTRTCPGDEEEETVTWLESLGVSQEDLSSINPKRKRPMKKGGNETKQENLVYIEGSQTQALVNFLLNSDLCLTSSGPLAGVPPTLLSHVAFRGATVKQLKIRQATSQTQDNKVLHTLDVFGPILPNALSSLSSLFCESQNGDFSVVLSSDRSTEALTAFTCSSGTPSAFAMESLKDSGLSHTFLEQICSANKENRRELSFLTKIKVQNGLYSWEA